MREWCAARNPTMLLKAIIPEVDTRRDFRHEDARDCFGDIQTPHSESANTSHELPVQRQGFSEDEASFLEVGIIDSFGFMELLHWVEDEFGISVADDELIPDNFDSVRRLSSFILRKKSGGA